MENTELSGRNIFEKLRQQDPTPIFFGAVISKNNNLATKQGRFYALVKDMKDGVFAYPESIKPKVDSITIHDGGHYIGSEEIDGMFARLSVSKNARWTNVAQGIDSYQITEAALFDFFEEWQDDYEALEFFQRCGDYLSLDDLDDKTG